MIEREKILRQCTDTKILVPDPDDCGVYFDCKTKKRMPCPEKLVFDISIQRCNYPKRVKGCENYIMDSDRGKI